MRKIAASLLAAACAFTSATAVFAANAVNQDVYYSNDNSVQINNSNLDTGKTLNDYTTVLIRKTPDDPSADIVENDVVYINQNSSGLGALSSFMLKSGAEAGNYTASFGNYEGDTKDITFEIFGTEGVTVNGDENTSATVKLEPQYKMNVVEDATEQDATIANDLENGLYTKSFRFLNSDTSLDRIYLVSEDGTTCYGYFDLTLPAVSGVAISYGIKLYNIPNEKRGMNIYLAEQPTQEGTE